MPSADKDRQARGLINSKVVQYPENVLDALDDVIRRGHGSIECMKTLARLYRGDRVPPSRDTMETYVRKRREQIKEGSDRQLSVQRTLTELLDLTAVDFTDKRGALLAVKKNMAARIEKAKEIQENLLDPRFEKIIVEGLTQLRETIVEEVKLEEKAGFGQQRIQVVVSVLLKHISTAITQAYKDVNGEGSLDAFTKALEKRLDVLPIDLIEQDILSAAEPKDVNATEESA